MREALSEMVAFKNHVEVSPRSRGQRREAEEAPKSLSIYLSIYFSFSMKLKIGIEHPTVVASFQCFSGRESFVTTEGGEKKGF